MTSNQIDNPIQCRYAMAQSRTRSTLCILVILGRLVHLLLHFGFKAEKGHRHHSQNPQAHKARIKKLISLFAGRAIYISVD